MADNVLYACSTCFPFSGRSELVREREGPWTLWRCPDCKEVRSWQWVEGWTRPPDPFRSRRVATIRPREAA